MWVEPACAVHYANFVFVVKMSIVKQTKNVPYQTQNTLGQPLIISIPGGMR